jgi:hypothetical protein
MQAKAKESASQTVLNRIKFVLTSKKLVFPKKVKINLSSKQITGRARKQKKDKRYKLSRPTYSGYRNIIMAQVNM